MESQNHVLDGYIIPLEDIYEKYLERFSFLCYCQFYKKLVTKKAIQNIKSKLFSSNPGDAHATIWALLVFQHWWKRNF